MEWTLAKDFGLVVATALLTWFFTYPKQKAEISKTQADARRADAEIILSQTDKILALLDAIDTARASARADEDEIAKLTVKLENCLSDGDCKGKRMQELVRSVLTFLADVENHAITEDDELVKELRKLKRMLERESV